MADQTPHWYVIHTYSGYENKVLTGIEKLVELRNLRKYIFDVRVPTEKVQEVKEDGEVVETERKLFPGYVLLNMIIDDDAWIMIKSIRGVTGFVGPEGKPVPLTDEEVKKLNFISETVKAPFNEGDNVRVTAGPMKDFTGIVETVDMNSKKVRVILSMGGRDIPAEIDLDSVCLL